MSEPVFTFTPKFKESIPVRQNVSEVWIGDGTNGEYGMLYARYTDGSEPVALGSVSLYPLAVDQAHYSGTAEEWITDLVGLMSSGKGAVADTKYYSSDSGDINPAQVPAGSWTTTPNIQKGKYLWSKITLTWRDESTSDIYTVTYVGEDGGVASFNGATGTVIAYGSTIMIDANSNNDIKTYIDGEIDTLSDEIDDLTGDNIIIEANSQETIKDYIDNLVFEPNIATDANINALFGIETQAPGE